MVVSTFSMPRNGKQDSFHGGRILHNTDARRGLDDRIDGSVRPVTAGDRRRQPWGFV